MKVIPTTFQETTIKPRFIPFKKTFLDHHSHMSEVPIWISTESNPLETKLGGQFRLSQS
jgi:hypothetical protein